MQLTERDRRVLQHLAAARWLSTGQVAALVFPQVSRAMACRRLRLLRRARFVRAARENPMMEALHTLGPRGREVLAEIDGAPPKLERQPPANRRHFLGINDLRVAVLASAAREGLRLNYFYACWELAGRGWPYALIPDAVVEVEAEGRTAAALFEYDRATEGLAYLVERKLLRYAAGLDGFPFARVVTVVEQPRRLEQIIEQVARRLRDPRFVFLLRDALGGWRARDLLSRAGSGEGSREGRDVGTGLGL